MSANSIHRSKPHGAVKKVYVTGELPARLYAGEESTEPSDLSEETNAQTPLVRENVSIFASPAELIEP
jgi:hypothetical protein